MRVLVASILLTMFIAGCNSTRAKGESIGKSGDDASEDWTNATYTRFANVTCLEDAGFFEISATGIYNVGDNTVEKSSGLRRMDRKLVSRCTIKGVEYQVTVDPVASVGKECPNRSMATITVKKKDKLLLDSLPFNTDCSFPDLTSVSVHPIGLVTLCGTDLSPGKSYARAFCVYDFSVMPSDGRAIDRNVFFEFINSSIK